MVMVNEQDVIALVSELVKIDSSNPWLIEGAAGEREVAHYIARWLAPLGVEVSLEDVEPGRPNVVARWRGTGGGASLCIYAHSDTVGYGLWADRALQPRVEGDLLYGIGACDDKGHVAAALLTLKALVESGRRLRGDVWLAFPVDEEGASSGTMHFVRHYQPNAAIVLEPFGLGSITITHQGFGWLDIMVYGTAAHGSAPETGVDAILHMAEVITRLHRLDREKFTPAAHPLNGKTVFHTSTIHGGTDYATYPDRCVLGIEIGTQPGETIADRIAEIEAIFAEVRAVHPTFRGEVRINIARDPFEAAGYERLWTIVARHTEALAGVPVQAVGLNAWGDAALFQAAGIPTLMFGAQGANLHAPDEWVSLSDLAKLVTILEASAVDFCGLADES